MSVKFNPQAVGETAQSRETLPEGIYQFRVLKAKETTSKSGNDMMETTLQIHNKGNSGQVRDYLGAWAYGEVKIINFLDCVGLPTAKGELHANQLVDRRGYLKLTVKDSTNPKYPGPQNNVARYYSTADMITEGFLKPGTAPLNNPEAPPIATSPAAVIADDFLDDCPF